MGVDGHQPGGATAARRRGADRAVLGPTAVPDDPATCLPRPVMAGAALADRGDRAAARADAPRWAPGRGCSSRRIWRAGARRASPPAGGGGGRAVSGPVPATARRRVRGGADRSGDLSRRPAVGPAGTRSDPYRRARSAARTGGATAAPGCPGRGDPWSARGTGAEPGLTGRAAAGAAPCRPGRDHDLEVGTTGGRSPRGPAAAGVQADGAAASSER